MTTRIINGDALHVLRSMESETVHCAVTSPPYWGLRSYGGETGMIGLEDTFPEHLENLVAVFGEVRRVLRKDGTFWLNYGDAYAGKSSGGGGGGELKGKQATNKGTIRKRQSMPENMKQKDLMLLPARVAIALQEDGWWLRSEIIWYKPNPMPESVTDRPTQTHEKIFLLTKSSKYFFDAVAVSEECKHAGQGEVVIQERKNIRNVWTIPVCGFKDAHFATFPTALVEPCIKAGTSETGCCHECGAPWTRQVEKHIKYESGSGKTGNPPVGKYENTEQALSGDYDVRMGPVVSTTTTGWQPTCKCSVIDEVVPCTVLDPFGGSGTVGLVADRLQRDAILIEINDGYADMAKSRINQDAPLFANVIDD